MAPYHQAATVAASAEVRVDGRKVYEGNLDPTWNIVSVPCGGYALALILQACIQHQATTGNADPLHITSHFLAPTNSRIPFKIYVQTLKPGKSFSNLVAEMYQEGTLRITAHAIFGTNGPTSNTLDLALQHPSPYARHHPVHIHPSQAQHDPLRDRFNFGNNIIWGHDDQIISKNAVDHPTARSDSSTIGGGGVEWGGYLQFESPSERLSNAYLPFLADMFPDTIDLLPESERGSAGASWFPTMTLSLEFKFPISQLSPEKHSLRTVGLYSRGKFINYPQGRHDVYVEVWSAPSNIGEGGPPKEGWREEQICLATATQMALTVPIALNVKNAQRTEATPKL